MRGIESLHVRPLCPKKETQKGCRVPWGLGILYHAIDLAPPFPESVGSRFLIKDALMRLFRNRI